MLGLAASLAKGGASLLTYVKDNLKLYLDFKSNRSDTLAFPSEGSTSFDGNDYINCGNDSSLQITSALSISSWIKTDNNSKYMFLVNKNDNTNVCYYSEIFNNGQLFFRIVSGGTNYSVGNTANTQIADGNWHHYCCVFEPSTSLKIYIDGELKETNTTSIPATIDNDTVNLEIGRRGDDNHYFEGKMANTAIWSRVLSPEEVQSVMNKSYSQLGSVEKTSLVSWWALDNAVLGSELITDGDFSSSDNWTEPSGWTIDTAQGKAIYVPPVNNISYNIMKYTNATLNASAEYEITITIDSCDNFGNCGIIKSGSIRAFSPTILNSTGTTTFSIVVDRTDFQLWSQNASITISNVSVKEKNVHTDSKGSNNGVNVGATTTTSVYGGNAPILPRAIDIAESFADKIGNGSALFNGSTDLIQVNASSSINNLFEAGGTFTAWVNLDGAGETAGRVAEKIFTVYTSTSDGSSSCKLSFNAPFSTTSGDWITTNREMIYGEWQHIAITYSGSSTSNNPIIYINGISVAITEGSTPNGTISADTANLYIGNNSATTRAFDGEMSQLGLWRGVLSQEMVQSVMESTSYAKIPASVKSNLGSEKVANATDWTDSNSDGLADNWTNQYSESSNPRLDYSIVTGNGFTENAQRFDVNSENGNDRAIRTSATVFTSGTLYKVSFKYRASISSGSILVMDGGSGTNVTNITTHTGDAKLFETYYVAPTGSHLWFYMQNADANAFMEIDEVSVKEVINDLVAYYPLDADNSNTVKTDDLVGGETLGSNFVDDHQESHYSHIGTTMDNITNGVKFTYGSNANGGYVYLKGASILSGNLNYGNLYKATFNAYYEGGSSGVSVSIYQGAGSDVFGDVLTTSNAEYSIYFIPLSAAAFIRLQNFASSNIVYLTNLQIQEVTSNTGVLL